MWFRDVCIGDCEVQDIAPEGMYIKARSDHLPDRLPIGAQVSIAYISENPEAHLVCCKGLVVHSEDGGAGLLTREVECGDAERQTSAA